MVSQTITGAGVVRTMTSVSGEWARGILGLFASEGLGVCIDVSVCVLMEGSVWEEICLCDAAGHEPPVFPSFSSSKLVSTSDSVLPSAL